MEFKLKCENLGEIVYLLLFCIMLGVKMAGFYDGQSIFKAALIIYSLLFLVKVIVTSYTKNEYILIALLVALSVVVYLNTGEKGLFLCFTTMLGVKGVSIKKVFCVGAIESAFIFGFNVFFRAFGILSEVYDSNYRKGIGMQIRHSLGYAHPNTLQISFLLVTILVIYVATKYRFHVIPVSIIFVLLNLYVYKYSGSRTGFISSIVFIIVNIWLYYRQKLSVFEKVAFTLVYPMVCIVSILFPRILPSKLFSLLDDYVFNFRYTVANFFMDSNPVSLFGIRLYYPEQIPYGIDIAALYLFLQLGIIAFIVVGAISIYFVHYSINNNMYAELAVFTVISFAGLCEPFLYNASYKNVAFVLFGAAIFGDKIKEWSLERKDISGKRLCFIIVISVLVGFVTIGMFRIFVKPYNELYADIETPNVQGYERLESMELSVEEQNDIIERGALILKNNKDSLVFYKYDAEVARKEYNLRLMSAFVLSACVTFLICCFGFRKYGR